MDNFRIDARRWRFLDNPTGYLKNDESGLQIEPLKRQFKTAKAILTRFKSGQGILLADDVGLGKTTVGALVAWSFACQEKRVRIYAPNEVLRRRWAEELERHVPMLDSLGASCDRIKQGKIGKLNAGRIQVATHDALIKSYGNNEQRTACDLMIIDEAHRAKGEKSKFKEALNSLGDRANRKLILTATPFSIDIQELERMLHFVGATKLDAIRNYAADLKRLYSLNNGHDVATESKRLVSSAKAAIEALRPFLIRHDIDDLTVGERAHFGTISHDGWEIPTPHATPDDLALLLRMDRLLHLLPDRKGERKNDPRFHIGWQHVRTELERASTSEHASDPIVLQHLKAASAALNRRTNPHPKIAAVSDAIHPILNAGEKVLVFCHHRATARELLCALEKSLETRAPRSTPPEKVWRAAWERLLPQNDALIAPIIDWLCSPGLRRQISGWLEKPASTIGELEKQLSTTRPRHIKDGIPTILDAAKILADAMLDPQSKSTRALLKNIARKVSTFGGKISHFPGRMDDGLRVMGAWHNDQHDTPPSTLYTGKPDIVLSLFNSPFGPDVLVTTDWLSEGVDLHRNCRHLIHYELDPSPVRTIQRNGRVRRVGSWAALTDQPIQYAYPSFGGTRDEKAVGIMRQRINAFGLLLGGVPSLQEDLSESTQSFPEQVIKSARGSMKKLNRKLCVP